MRQKVSGDFAPLAIDSIVNSRSFGGGPQVEPAIRTLAPGVALDSGFAPAARPGMTRDKRHRPRSLVGPGQALVCLPYRGSRTRGAERRQALGLARPPQVGRLTIAPFLPCDRVGTRLPALHCGVLRCAGRAFGTWTSHARQPAPGGRSYCLRAEPRHRPGFCSALLQNRGAASIDGGISPLGRPGEALGRISTPVSPLLASHGVP